MGAENVGKVVEYRSRPYNAARTVEIVAYVEAHKDIKALLPAGATLDAYPRSDVNRYLVREDRKGAKGQALMARWYAPHASIVDRAMAEGGGK